ncbi:uncharacterized protein ARMOST_13978 [Armillaria ostoyae]|uniref:Uncharacterized protein n=1 Tax=Armillaria ostoyae TaxID=47428 RepID=A0A284RP97_ARMOS|nr:uncharacterized protein ARMOST_13978 [Armillaria ostoyae]
MHSSSDEDLPEGWDRHEVRTTTTSSTKPCSQHRFSTVTVDAELVALGRLALQSSSSTATLDDPNKPALLDSLPPHRNVSYKYEGFPPTPTMTYISRISAQRRKQQTRQPWTRALVEHSLLNHLDGFKFSLPDYVCRWTLRVQPVPKPIPCLQAHSCRPPSLYTGRPGFSLPHWAPPKYALLTIVPRR